MLQCNYIHQKLNLKFILAQPNIFHYVVKFDQILSLHIANMFMVFLCCDGRLMSHWTPFVVKTYPDVNSPASPSYVPNA